MSLFNDLAMYENVVPLKQPIDAGTTDFTTGYVNLKGAHKIAFLVQFGVTTENATTDVIDITVDGATTDNAGTEGQVGFNYRKSSAVTANTWGAVTVATSAGIDLTDEDEGMSLWIEPDMGALATNDYGYVRLAVALNAFTVCLVSIVAFVDARYSMTTMQSVTASASA